MVAYTCNPNTLEAEAGESLRNQCYPGLPCETLSQKTKMKETKQQNPQTKQNKLGVVTCACNPSAWETNIGDPHRPASPALSQKQDGWPLRNKPEVDP